MPATNCTGFGRKFVCFLVCASLLSGCTSWSSNGLTPRQLVSTKNPKSVRIVLRDETVLEFKNPYVIGDRIAADPADVLRVSDLVPDPRCPLCKPIEGKPRQPDHERLYISLPDRVEVAVSNIQTLEVKQVDRGKTALLVGSLVAVPIVLVLVVREMFSDLDPITIEGGAYGN